MIPFVTAAQMRHVDRLMLEEVGISLLQMMENAGRGLAGLARAMLGGDPRRRRVTVLAGPGGNGGGGLAAARRLANWGAEVEVLLTGSEAGLAAAPAHQLSSLRWMGVPVRESGSVDGANLILDAIFGYSLAGAPSGRAAELIEAANAASVPILALDLPSGLHPDTGEALEPAIRATATLMLALPKAGPIRPRARAWTGDLYLADISVPELVYRRLGLEVGPIFAGSARLERIAIFSLWAAPVAAVTAGYLVAGRSIDYPRPVLIRRVSAVVQVVFAARRFFRAGPEPGRPEALSIDRAERIKTPAGARSLRPAIERRSGART